MVRGIQALTFGPSSPGSRRRWRRYLRGTRRPLHCLLFLAPLVLAYEVGRFWTAPEAGPARDLLAPSVIRNLLAWFGLVGFWVPPAVLVLVLLYWHRRRGDRWKVHWWVFPWMPAECVALAVPLLVVSGLFEAPPRTRVLDALGAGVYEELIFRLLLISGLTWLLAHPLRAWPRVTVAAAVAVAAVVFALCHYFPLAGGGLEWRSFWLRFVGGTYLGVIFVGRGLGISTGCHVAYNVLLVLLRGSLSPPAG